MCKVDFGPSWHGEVVSKLVTPLVINDLISLKFLQNSLTFI